MEGADGTETHKETDTRGAGVPGGVKRRERQQAVLAHSQPLPARTYRWRPAAFAPRSLPVSLTGHFARGTIAFLSVPAPLPVLSRLSRPLAGQDLWVPGWAGIVALLGAIIRVEQGAALFDAPTALRCPAPLADQPRPTLLSLHARPLAPARPSGAASGGTPSGEQAAQRSSWHVSHP